MVPHPLLTMFTAAWQGTFPAAGGDVVVVPAAGRVEAVVAFTGHAVVATGLPAGDVLARRPDGFGGAHAPDFLVWLARGRTIGVLDLLLVATGRGRGSELPARPDLADHPRVRYAHRLRDDVRVWGDDRGLITLARGLAGRPELSVEATAPGNGHGRALVAAALDLSPADEPVFAAVSPGNVRSLQTFLTAGFRPVAGEVQLWPEAVDTLA